MQAAYDHNRDFQAYFSVKQYGPPTDRLIFIFGGWRVKPVLYQPFIRTLVKRGYHCILYVPSTSLIGVGTPYAKLVTATRVATGDVADKIKQEQKRGTQTFSAVGISLGTMFAMETAKLCDAVHKVMLVAPFGDFAEHVKHWPRHPYFSKVLASQPTDQKGSGEVLNQAGTVKRLDKLAGKQVFINYSDKDTVIHSEATAGLIDQLARHKIDAQITRVSGNHAAAVLKGLVRRKAYLKFLATE